MDLKHVLWMLRQKSNTRTNCYLHCHAFGLHSFALHEQESGTRIFIADTNHVLYHNNPVNGFIRKYPMSLGYHQHRRNITLQHLAGAPLYNVNAEIADDMPGGWSLPLRRYDTASPILKMVDGEERMEYPVKRSKKVYYAHNISIDKLYKEQASKDLPAESHHTVYVEMNKVCIWAVHEGAFVHDTNHFYTNAEVLKGWNKDLYQDLAKDSRGFWIQGTTYDSVDRYIEHAWKKAKEHE